MQTSLATRRLGTTEMELTTVGFGAWAIGGGDWTFGWGPQDDEDSIATIRYAVERGINWIDTAAVYGLGHSEEIVRRALDEVPATERPYVFTKCGMVWDDADRMAPPRQVLRPESIRRECEASLRRLGVERIDLYQFHWPDETGVAVGGLLGRDGAAGGRGEGPRGRSLQLRRAAARALRGAPPRGFAPAAVLAHPAAGRGAARSRGARPMAPASSSTAPCNRASSPTASAPSG